MLFYGSQGGATRDGSRRCALMVLTFVCMAWLLAACDAGDGPTPGERRAQEEQDAAARSLERSLERSRRANEDGGETSDPLASPLAGTEITAYEWHESEEYGYRFLRPTNGWNPTEEKERPDDASLERNVYAREDGDTSISVAMRETEPGPLWSELDGVREALDEEFGGLAARKGGEVYPCRASETKNHPAVFECLYEYAADGGTHRVIQIVYFEGNRRYDLTLKASPDAMKRHGETFLRVVSSLGGPDSVRYESEKTGFGFDHPSGWVVGRPNLLVAGAEDRGAGEPERESLALLPPDEEAVIFFELYGPFEDRGAADFEKLSRGAFRDSMQGLDGEMSSPCEMIEQRREAYVVECAGRYTDEGGWRVQQRQVFVAAGGGLYTMLLESAPETQERFVPARDEILFSLLESPA